MANVTPIHGNHDEADDVGGNPNVAKATAMVVLFATSFILGCLPIKLNQIFKWNDAKNNQYVKCLLGLGGGVLMCTTFIHLLPEVSESFEDLDLNLGLKIPFPELLMCIGFFIIFFVEECVHVYLHRKVKLNSLNVVRKSLSLRGDDFNDTEKCESLEPPKNHIRYDHSHSHSHNHHHVDHSHVMIDYSGHSTVVIIRGLLVVMALSIHELFEGLAVGLESSASNVWYMFGAVSAHKFVIAFCIGVDLVASGIKTSLVVIYIFTFAVVSPLGIGIGLLITNAEDNSTTMVSVILQGLATGTLLYIVFFEILQADKKSGLKQYLSILVGFTIMFGITLIEA